MSALVAFAKRQTGVERLEWLQPKQEDLVIESLKRWLGRA
jgi:phage-related protein